MIFPVPRLRTSASAPSTYSSPLRYRAAGSPSVASSCICALSCSPSPMINGAQVQGACRERSQQSASCDAVQGRGPDVRGLYSGLGHSRAR